jgi:hypothetical protein
MGRKIGSVITLPTPQPIGPGNGTEVSPGRWRVTFSPPPLPSTGTKFLILHFTEAELGLDDKIEVNLIYDTDIFDLSSGPSFWSRPVRGNSVEIDFVDGSGGIGSAVLSQYGRGEGLQRGGDMVERGGCGNGDLFLMDLVDSPFQEPTFFADYGVCPEGASPSWENVDCLPPGLMRETARSVGMIIGVSEDTTTGELVVNTCSAALIDADLVLTAGHCLSEHHRIESTSFTLDFQTDCEGYRPEGYNPRFHKLKQLRKTGYLAPEVGAGLTTGTGVDYAIFQIETPPEGIGVPPLPLRDSTPGLGEGLFVIHHPRATTKKVSRQPTDPTCQVLSVSERVISYACDSDHGSSGSPVIDSAGRIVAVNDWAPGSCNNQGQSSAIILQDFLTEAPPARDVDVVLVLDRSGSMNLEGLTGVRKIEEARQAASLFIDLLRTDQTHRVGMVTFSTRASSPAEFALDLVTEENKQTLIGPPPDRDSGIVADISPGGTTSIGDGLQAGQAQLPPATPAANTPAILLLTDGLQNTHPMIDEVEDSLGSTNICIIGFGSEASLDGPLLTSLARNHRGIYTRAGEGLELKKFFVLSFGNIFHTAVATDPFFVLPDGATDFEATTLQICAEKLLTVVLSWEHSRKRLNLVLVTPAGNAISANTPGIVSSEGSTWVYFRIPLPFNSEREGTWKIRVTRSRGAGDIPEPLPAERFFVTAVVDGGPFFHPVEPGRYYTGDTINPRVVLREPSGMLVPARVTVEVEMPQEGTGNILTRTGLGAGGEQDGDQIDPRANTLIGLERDRGRLLIPTITKSFELFDDGERDGDGSLERDGIFGNPLEDITRHEGNYTFHARASYGKTITGTRETTWSVYVEVGIDPEYTEIEGETVETLPDGRKRVRLRFTPRDRYGNYLGPGRLGTFEADPQPGSEPVGGVKDEGDGSYTQDVAWDAGTGNPPRVSLRQPDRPPVTVGLPEMKEKFVYCVKFVCGVQEECGCECPPVRPGKYATEINIYNFNATEVKVDKHILPLVFAGAPSGREPQVVTRRASDTIVLPPHSATMDDCCRIAGLLLGAEPALPQPLTLGFLEIVSPVELQVTAVYTVTDLNSGSTSMDVENIDPKKAVR